ncbi:Carboxylesterase 5A [Fragariocoptes setiger]|uniref:Carboxylesterase 5A n=1 Tax=Fragariocoptes setiger TaxID=1670756 RepID=A0ABQ7SD14_9ACAR|nr:Carboxylesterase 5A [Fragariocoptes setiger]
MTKSPCKASQIMLNNCNNTTATAKNVRYNMSLLHICTTLFALLVPAILAASSSHQPLSSSLVSTSKDTTNTTIIVSTTSGRLSGAHVINGNSSVYQFLSVPYAEAPIGARRFQRPVALSAVRQLDTLDATQLGPTCVQYRHITNFISPLLNLDESHKISEDCLKLHVYVPVHAIDNPHRGAQLPVIIWIPGEGFDFADARQFDATHLAARTNSIVISVQYRVGVFGFLNEPSIGANGNQGLYDQLAALEWVQNNAAAFGGDAHKVTLMGRFTGAMSISHLITSSRLSAKDSPALFQKAILMSGIAVNEWTIDRRPEEKLAQLKNALTESSLCGTQDFDTCLMQMPAESLLQASGYEWRPIVDNELIVDEPVKALTANHKFANGLDSVMIGSTQNEGLLCLYRHLLSEKSPYGNLIQQDQISKQDIVDMIRDDANIYFKLNLNESGPIDTMFDSLLASNEIGASSSNNSDDDNNNNSVSARDLYLNACTNYMIKSHADAFKRNLVRKNILNRSNMNERPVKIYQYELKYRPTFSNAPKFIKSASHGDDVLLMFGLAYTDPQASQRDLATTRKMMAYLKSFVHNNIKHGSIAIDSIPSVDEHDDDDPTTMEIGNNGVELIEHKEWPADGAIFVFDATIDSINNPMMNLAHQFAKLTRMYEEAKERSESDSNIDNNRSNNDDDDIDNHNNNSASRTATKSVPIKIIVIESGLVSSSNTSAANDALVSTTTPSKLQQQPTSSRIFDCDHRNVTFEFFMIVMIVLVLVPLILGLATVYVKMIVHKDKRKCHLVPTRLTRNGGLKGSGQSSAIHTDDIVTMSA